MLTDMLRSDNPLIRYGVAALVVFGPLYLLQTYNVQFAWTIAIIILVMVVMANVGRGASFA